MLTMADYWAEQPGIMVFLPVMPNRRSFWHL